jgi:endonuclease/exonuclease/phosphatase (EEP) superfamily protein YafD
MTPSDDPVAAARERPMEKEGVGTKDGGGRLRRRMVLLGAVLAAALVQPVASLLSGVDWRADLLSHFQEPALLTTLLAVALFARRNRRLALGLAALAVFQLGPLFRYSGTNPVPPVPRTGDRLRLLVANVFVDNHRFRELARLIERERPDVVGLVECSQDWLDGLQQVRAEFPYRVEAPDGARGLALWFRRPPLAADRPERLRPDAWPILHARVSLADRPLDLWLVHPHSPIHRKAMRSGNPELAAIGERVGQVDGRRVVVGDMNTTDGSANFTALLRRTGLRDSRLGFGRQGSFPTFFPYRIALDHALVSPEIAVVDRRLGPDIGSDHFPLIVELAPAAGAVKAVTHASHASAE